MFDSSREREPLDFIIGAGKVSRLVWTCDPSGGTPVVGPASATRAGFGCSSRLGRCPSAVGGMSVSCTPALFASFGPSNELPVSGCHEDTCFHLASPQVIKGFDTAVSGLVEGGKRKQRIEPKEVRAGCRDEMRNVLTCAALARDGPVTGAQPLGSCASVSWDVRYGFCGMHVTDAYVSWDA